MSQETKNEHFENKALQLQIELFHKSNEITDHAVGRLDDIISKLRNWTIVLWAGSIALAINSDNYHLIPFTAFIPLPFWISNVFYNKHLLACSYRQETVAENFNTTSKVTDIFKQQDFGNFNVFDPLSVLDEKKPKYRKKVNLWKAIFFKDTIILYLSLVVISLVAGALLK